MEQITRSAMSRNSRARQASG